MKILIFCFLFVIKSCAEENIEPINLKENIIIKPNDIKILQEGLEVTSDEKDIFRLDYNKPVEVVWEGYKNKKIYCSLSLTSSTMWDGGIMPRNGLDLFLTSLFTNASVSKITLQKDTFPKKYKNFVNIICVRSLEEDKVTLKNRVSKKIDLVKEDINFELFWNYYDFDIVRSIKVDTIDEL